MREVFRKHQKGLLMAIAMLILAFSSIALADTQVDMGTLQNGKAVEKIGLMDNQGYIWFKFNAPSDGFLEVSGFELSLSTKNTFNIIFSLYDAGKKRIDAYAYEHSVSSENKKAVHYGVGKGVHYIRMKATDSSNYGYSIYAYFEGKKSTGGPSKGKALKMKKGKVYNVVIPAGKKKTVWFKFTTNGKKKPKFIAYTRGQGQIKFMVKGNGLKKSIGYLNTRNEKDGFKISTEVRRNGLLVKQTAPKKGTYLVKLTTYNSCNGWMKIKWKY